jgi:hypothetical protein
MSRVRLAFVVAVVGGFLVGCQQHKDVDDVPVYRSSGNYDRSSTAYSSSSSSSSSTYTGDPNTWVVQVRSVSVKPSADGVSVRDTPAVGERVTVQGEMSMKALSSIEALAHVGRDFESRANVGDTVMSLTGHLNRAGGDDAPYRVSLSFKQTDPNGTTQQTTNIEVRPNEPKMIAGDSGGRGVVLTLKRPESSETR